MSLFVSTHSLRTYPPSPVTSTFSVTSEIEQRRKDENKDMSESIE